MFIRFTPTIITILFLVLTWVAPAMAQSDHYGDLFVYGRLRAMGQFAGPYGTTLPATCNPGDEFFKTDAVAGQNKYYCTNTNVWTQGAGGGGGGWTGPARTTVTFSATPTFARTQPLHQFVMSLTGNVTSSTITGLVAGDVIWFTFTQSTAANTVALPTGFPDAGLVCPTVGSTTVLEYAWNGTAAVRQGYASSGCGLTEIVWGSGNRATFPDANDTVAMLGQSQTFTGPKIFNDITVPGTNGNCLQKNSSTGKVETAAAPCGSGGGGGTSTSGLCGLATACAIPAFSMSSAAWGLVANRVYIIQFVMPYTKTITTLGGFSSGGGGLTTDGMAFGIYNDSSNAPTSLLAGCAFVDVTAGSVMKTCSTSATLTGGTTYWLAATVQNTAMTMRVLDTMFAQMLTSVPSSVRAGYCANVSTGTGTGLTLPAACGSVTLAAFQMPFIYAY